MTGVAMIRGIIQTVVEGAIKRFTASGRSDETVTDREAMEHYGFTSRPQPGAEHVSLAWGNHIIMIASDDRRYRIACEPGEVSLYDDAGQRVHLTRTGIVAESPAHITATAPVVDVEAVEATVDASSSATIKAPTIALQGSVITMAAAGGGAASATLTGNWTVTGNISVTGNITATGTIIDGAGNTNHHTH